MVKYFSQKVDENCFTHSIDMVKAWYYCYDNHRIIDICHSLRDKYNLDSKTYYEKDNLTPCQHYSFWSCHIHLGDIYIKIGKYTDKFDKDSKGHFLSKNDVKYIVTDCFQVEVNPNKHFDSGIFRDFMDLIKSEIIDGYLSGYDYTIDLPCSPDDVVVLSTRKMPGLYKGTRYFGVRAQHGFVKIYDKQKESNLDSPLTRIEVSLKSGKPFSFIKFGVVHHDKVDSSGLSRSTALIVEMLDELRLLGSDNVEHYLSELNFKTRVKVQSALSGDVKPYEFDDFILRNDLLPPVMDLFHCSDHPAPERDPEDDLIVDEDGFMKIDPDYDDLPIDF